MRLACYVFWATACFVPTHFILAGNYPAATNSSQTFEFADGITDLGDGSLIGSEQLAGTNPPVAGVFGSALRLAEKTTTNAIASFKLPDLDPGNVIKSFDLRFTVAMGSPAAGSPGEGWSVNFGRIPDDNGTGEGGFAPLPGGLTIAFDTLDNGNDPPSIEVFIGGVSIADFPRTFLFDAASRLVMVHWDAAGLASATTAKWSAQICQRLASLRAWGTSLPSPRERPLPRWTFFSTT